MTILDQINQYKKKEVEAKKYPPYQGFGTKQPFWKKTTFTGSLASKKRDRHHCRTQTEITQQVGY